MVNNAAIFIITSIVLTMVSFLLDRKKTVMGLKKGWKMFQNIAIPFVNILIAVSLVLYFLPPSLIMKYLGTESGWGGQIIAAVVGSITLIPGFISYPVASVLIQEGASYTTVATFMTTLMMVGIVTLPLEIKYFGRNAAIMRNVLNFVAAIMIGSFVGFML
ncbi:MAG: hypothetical protein A4E73_01604 [Syntrophaceae bacterium PtaU1.Bin231]|nr:MAG: hypothetical protein A4E73_01604 [Syntrophaceae bacterium PtaU1.Bin231]